MSVCIVLNLVFSTFLSISSPPFSPGQPWKPAPRGRGEAATLTTAQDAGPLLWIRPGGRLTYVPCRDVGDELREKVISLQFLGSMLFFFP